MRNNTGVQVQVEDGADNDAPNSVSFELPPGTEIESIVLAYRHDGELVELAERTVPAAAELHGELE